MGSEIRLNGDLLQVMPLVNQGSTSGADDINVSSMLFIEFDTEVTVYWDGASSATFSIPANKAYGVKDIKTLHVNTATNYVWC